MKKIFTLLFALLGQLIATAQTSTLIKLVDSLPNGGNAIVEVFNNKLYTLPSHVGGDVFEIDPNTGASTLVANIPIIPGTWEYQTSSGNFVYMKNKTVVSLMGTNAGGTNSVLAVGLSTVDTLLKDHYANGRILNIDTMCYLIFNKSNAGTYPRLYATNLNSPVSMMDTSIRLFKQGSSQLFYVKSHTPGVYDYTLSRTNGISSWVVETASGTDKQIAIIGEVNGEMYYTVTHRTPPTNDIIYLKKCDAVGMTSLVDTIMGDIAVFDNGLVGFANKLIIPVKHETAPYHQDVLVYDLANNTYTNITQNTIFIGTTDMDFQQTNVAPNHIYFNAINPQKAYISDGTASGTKPYGSLSGFGTILDFETYWKKSNLGNGAHLCNEYPVGNLKDELFIGTDTGRVEYKLWAGTKSYPSHFRQISNSVYFRIHNGSYTKMSLMKLTGCDIPVSNPLGIGSNFELEASVYPNPSEGKFSVVSDLFSDSFSIEVYNQLGQSIAFQTKKMSKGVEVELINASKGVYFLDAKTKSGRVIKKLIVE